MPDGDLIRRLRRPASAPAKQFDEAGFQKWYRGWANKTGIDPNPDHPAHKYDYRGAYRANAAPKVSPDDGLYHWPSEFKADDHPNRYVDGIDTKTGKPRTIRGDFPTRKIK